MIPYGRQDISQADIDSVVTVLQSDFLTQGPAVPQFEKTVARRVQAQHGVAVNSATSALHIACLALGLGAGDGLWTSPISFVASANCGRYTGAQVDFVDIDPQTYNLCSQALEKKLIAAKRSGKLPKVVIPVHLSGQPCDMKRIHELADEYGFKVIEDASHAIGGSFRGEPIGSCRYSDVTVFSFHPVKIVTTGEGGMAVTNDTDLARHMARLRTHGITREPEELTRESDGPWYYEQIELGFNYRMTDLQAALGVSQVQRLDDFIARRRAVAARYHEAFAELPLTVPWQHPDGESAWHLYIIRLQRDQLAKTHREVFEAFRADGIGVNLHYIPIYRQPDFSANESGPEDFPRAEAYYAEAISLPMFPTLGPADQERVIEITRKILA